MGLNVNRVASLLEAAGAGLLLDLDGTLVESESVHRAAYRQYFSGRGWQVEEHVLGEFSGRRAPDVFATLDGPWTGEDPVALTEGVLDVLRNGTVQPKPVAGAARLIAACAKAGLPVAVVTSARRDWVKGVLDLLGVDEGTMPMVTAQDCEPGKPHPEPFRRGAELLGLLPADLVAAEDSPAGIASARTAGVGHVVGIRTSSPEDVLLAAGAHSTAPDLRTLADLVDTLNTTR